MSFFLKKKWLLVKINRKRSEMIFLGEKLGLTAAETISCSQQLDRLLNEYERKNKIELPLPFQETPYEFGQFIKSLLKKTA